MTRGKFGKIITKIMEVPMDIYKTAVDSTVIFTGTLVHTGYNSPLSLKFGEVDWQD